MVSSVEGPVLNGFRDVVGTDLLTAIEVCNRPGDLQDAMVRACRQPERLNGFLQYRHGLLVQGADLLEESRAHLRVGEYSELP